MFSPFETDTGEVHLRIVITGFTRFEGVKLNPTELMMEEIQTFVRSSDDCDILTEVLPTEFQRAGQRIVELISSINPDALLGFGVKPDSAALSLERFAINIDDSSTPDNAGWTPSGLPIIPDGPPAYLSTLPLEAMRLELLRAGFPVVYSNHAGTYVCNHVFYLACHHAASLPVQRRYGFIHVPTALETLGSKPYDRFSPLAGAVGICVDVLKDHFASTRRSTR